jgi:predicted Zn-dependent protease
MPGMDTEAPLSSFLGCRCHWPADSPRSPGRRLFTGLALAAAAAPALANMPECRRSRAASLAPASYVENMAQQQYAQMLRQAQQQRALARGGVQLERLRHIAARMVPFTLACNERARQWQWEVNLLGSDQINAFCMPGGKIAFYTGILARLKLDDDEVAMIMGHEVAHALLEHARERMIKSGGTELLLRGGAALLGLGSLGDAAAAGASQLLSLKYSRDDESQADALGLVVAAQAGYDPKAGVTLWQKMGRVGGDKPPPWLSTHPAGDKRIASIEARLPQVRPVFESAPKPPRRFGPPAG